MTSQGGARLTNGPLRAKSPEEAPGYQQEGGTEAERGEGGRRRCAVYGQDKGVFLCQTQKKTLGGFTAQTGHEKGRKPDPALARQEGRKSAGGGRRGERRLTCLAVGAKVKGSHVSCGISESVHFVLKYASQAIPNLHELGLRKAVGEGSRGGNNIGTKAVWAEASRRAVGVRKTTARRARNDTKVICRLVLLTPQE
jgi:hypothetical protein